MSELRIIKAGDKVIVADAQTRTVAQFYGAQREENADLFVDAVEGVTEDDLKDEMETVEALRQALVLRDAARAFAAVVEGQLDEMPKHVAQGIIGPALRRLRKGGA